jgi:7,8-dihydropterin-6-yl-methyl-4-(beta-D-ribofuranosyl)aminobenzene 5'-phosphate synthase
MGGNFIPVEELTSVKDDIFITGEIEGKYNEVFLPEQALFIKRKNGITVITGCAHPGIIKIIQKIKENFPEIKIKFVLGGFHLMNKDVREVELIVEKFREFGIEEVGPTHCSGSEAQTIFRKSYKDKYIQVAAGKAFNI